MNASRALSTALLRCLRVAEEYLYNASTSTSARNFQQRLHDAGSHNQLDVAGFVARTSRAVASDNFPPRPSTKQAVQFCKDLASLQVRLRAGRGCRQWTCGQLFVCMYDIAFEYLADPSQAARMPSQVKPETSKSAMSTPQQATVNSHSARHDVCSPAFLEEQHGFFQTGASIMSSRHQSVLHATEAVTPPSRRTRLAASATPRLDQPP